MYFLNEDERRYLVRGLIPRSRAMDVSEELRGWSWNRPPVEPAHDVRLGVWEVAGRYCPTARDLYLRRVMDVKPPPTAAMQAGQVLHGVVLTAITRAKRLLYSEGLDGYQDALAALETPMIEHLVKGVPEGKGTANGNASEASLSVKAERLWQFEARRIGARVEEALAHHPYIGLDALVGMAIPVAVEQKLDGTCLGLSAHLSVDGLTTGEMLVVDLKFGEPRDFHLLTLTGYAMVMEAAYEYPVNLGCLVYSSYQNGRWTIQRQFHAINERARQWFLEERDEKQRIVAEEIDPGTPGECPRWCGMWGHCHGESETVRAASSASRANRGGE